MEDDNDNEHRALLGWILGIAVTLSITVALVSGVVAVGGASKAPQAEAPKTEAPAAAPASAVTVKIFFESASVGLPDGADATLVPVVEAARARTDAALVISGFHDKTGDPEQNAELAKQRAQAVLNLLVAAGIAAERIELRKPAETEGGADDREARRVEVSVQ